MKRFYTLFTHHKHCLLILVVLLHACEPKETPTPINPPPPGTVIIPPVPIPIIGIDISNRKTVLESYFQEFNKIIPIIGWVGNIDDCQAGISSKSFIDAQLSRINYFRSMAGIDGRVSYIDSLNRKAQKAALIMASANKLNHNPPSFWKCYTTEGAQAAGRSNLAINYGDAPDFISQYIEDIGTSNAAVGHRRWILSPRIMTMGTGNVHSLSTGFSHNALWVINNNYFQISRSKTREEFVAWPSPGYIPYQIVYPRWSFHFDGADFSESQIKVKHNGTELTPAIVSNKDNGYGENAIVWEMPETVKPATDLTYEVTVQNVKMNNQSRSFTYKVIVIDPQ